MGAVGGRRYAWSRGSGIVCDRVSVCPPQPCPEAIKEVFHNKFHIIGAVGIGIAVVMVSAWVIGGNGPLSS